ncbi:MAG: hypothetical protein KGL39_56445, partial [Patescibacteria group bacterium]|nr:hypothetical protein [Patescibacteria group bacterium]
CYNHIDGSFYSSYSGGGGNQGNAGSKHSLTPGGVEDCSGSVSCGDGTVNMTANPVSSGTYNCWCVGGGTDCTPSSGAPVQLQVPSCDAVTDKSAARAANVAYLKNLCNATADRGIISLTVPIAGYFSGKASDFSAWITSENWEMPEYTHCETPDGLTWYRFINSSFSKFQVVEVALTATGLKISVSYSWQWKEQIYGQGSGDIGGNPCAGGTASILQFDGSENYGFNFTLDLELSGAYTFGQSQADAIALLNYWNLTDDAQYPWRTDGNCNIAPMVSLWEYGGTLSGGYCDTPADTTLTAIYDGSVRGAPMANGVYNPPFFDWAATSVNYSSFMGQCGFYLCTDYGYFMPSYLPSTATQFTTGALDTDDCGGSWQPYSRFKRYWAMPSRPPFVDISGGCIADGGDAVYAGKWAEIKEALPSQSFFGPCGAQRNATLIDTNCQATATKRWPAAWSICGSAAIASMSVTSGVVTVVLSGSGAPYLITGDAVDFLDAGDNVTTGGVVVTVDSATQFHFTGSLPTGVGIKSAGAPGPVWYDPAPKGDFIRKIEFGEPSGVTDTAEAGNIKPIGGKRAIIAVIPPGSPEIGNPKWPSATTQIYSDYPAILPTQHWYCTIHQAMSDRFYTDSQDGRMDNGAGGCTASGATVPMVEARLTAPYNAPYTFANADGNIENPMPTVAAFDFNCSGAWGFTDSTLPFDNWPFSNQATASATFIGATAGQTDAGLGTADQSGLL